MKSLQLIMRQCLGISLIILTGLLLPDISMAQEAVTVQLEAVGGSTVSGTATLTTVGDGTNVALDIQGLAPGETAQASLQANTCAMPSASFTGLSTLKADATGKAIATGAVLFHGTENIALAAIADGEHVITIRTGQLVACGVIPKLTSVSTPPAQLPDTGGASFSFIAIGAGILGLCVLLVGLFLRRGSRPVRRV